MLDWLAVYEIDPWSESRKDIRAAVTSLWNRGATFDQLELLYPHSSDTGEISEEDEAEAIAAIALERERELREQSENAKA